MRNLLKSPYVLLALATLFWGINNVVGKAAIPVIPAFSLSFWRWAIAFLFILPFGVKAVQRDQEFYRKNWRYLMMLGFISVTVYNTFHYWALDWTTAINVSVICATMPIVIFFFSWVIGGQNPKTNQTIGIILALVGVLTVVSKGKISVLMGLEINPGDILVLIAVVSFGIYSVLFKKFDAKVDSVGILSVFIFFGLIGIAPFYAWDIYHGHFFPINVEVLWVLFYVGIFPSLLSFFCWNKAIKAGGAHIAGMFFNLIPVFTSILAVFFLKEAFALFHLLGMLLIFSGIYFATFYKSTFGEKNLKRKQ